MRSSQDASTWRIYTAVALMLAAAHLTLSEPARNAVFLAIAVSGPVAAFVGVRRRSQCTGWWLILAGTAVMVAGDILWDFYDLIAGVDPFPSLADALYIPGYPLIAAGLLRMLRERGPASGSREGLIDGTVIATGSGVVSWVFLIEPYVRDLELTVAERVVSTLYPVMGILLVVVVARVLFAGAWESTSDLLLGLSLCALLIADTWLGVAELTTGYDWNAVPEFLWLAQYVLIGAAALAPPTSPTHGTPIDHARSRALLSLRLPLLTLASLMAPAVLAWYAVQGVQGHSVNLFVIASGSAALFLLVLARVLGLVHKIERQAGELARLASADPLTGLPNRRFWVTEIARLLALAARSREPICVAMIDLDHFKRFNDVRGHAAGDELLSECGQVWETRLRATDLLARVGGEEFALALPNCTPDEAEKFIDRLRAVTPSGQTFSCGLAPWDGHETHSAVLARADAAMYAAKRAGRDLTVCADGIARAPRSTSSSRTVTAMHDRAPL